MWKRLDESISLSEKWARLSWPAMGMGIYILSNSDSRGRYIADPRIIKSRCMTYRYDVRLDLIEDALLELERERVLHRYDADGKPYLVIHDHDEWNPPGALKNSAPKYPAPDPKLCECLRRDSGANAPLVMSSSSSSSSSEERRSGGERRIANTLAELWNNGPGEHLTGTTAANKVQAAIDVGVKAQDIEQAFWDKDSIKGKKIWEVLDPMRDKLRKSSVDGKDFRPVASVCANCGGSGKTVAGACPGCKKGRELRRVQA